MTIRAGAAGLAGIDEYSRAPSGPYALMLRQTALGGPEVLTPPEGSFNRRIVIPGSSRHSRHP